MDNKTIDKLKEELKKIEYEYNIKLQAQSNIQLLFMDLNILRKLYNKKIKKAVNLEVKRLKNKKPYLI